MPLVLADRVRETTTTTGTGTISLAGPVSGFQGFSTAIGNANTTYYTIADAATGAWEVGLGTYTSSGSTLARTTVLSSSNAGAAVNFAAGTKDVFVTQPAERALYLNGAGTGVDAGAAAFTANGVVYASSSSALTTGGALTFDGTRLTVNSGATNEALRLNATADTYIQFQRSGVSTAYIQSAAGAMYLWNQENTATLFGVNNAEQMRLTSTGLGIGTSSPAYKLDVRGLVTGGNGTIVGGISYSTRPEIGAISNHPCGFITNNTTQMLLDTSGNLGIGTSSPTQRLDVRGNMYMNGTNARIYVDNGGIGGSSVQLGVSGTSHGYIGTDGNFPLVFQPNNAEQMRLTSTGLGIGTTSPPNKLTVSNAGANGFEFDPASSLMQTYNRSSGAYTAMNLFALSMAFKTGASPATTMLLDSSGNLGIGTASPEGPFQVTTRFRVQSDGVVRWGSDVRAATYNESGYLSWNTGVVRIGYQGAGAVAFGNSAVGDLMTLDSSGNLGLGVTPSAWGSGKAIELGQVTGNALWGLGINSLYLTSNARWNGSNYVYTNNGAANLYGAGTGNGTFTWFTAPSGTAGDPITFTQAMTLDASGNLLVGATTAGGNGTTIYASGLIVANWSSAGSWSLKNSEATSGASCVDLHRAVTTGDPIFQYFGTEATFTTRGSISYNRAGGLVAYNTTSDYRAKDIIGPVQNPGATIDALKVYEGKMKGATQSRPMLVAHEAQAVAPYAVTGEKDAVNGDGTPKFQQMDVSSLVPLLLAELQLLRRRVAQLEGNQP